MPFAPAAVVVGTLVLLLVGVVLLLPTLSEQAPDVWGFPGVVIVPTLGLLVLGYALATRRAENPIGWLFLLAAFLGAVQVVANHYARYALVVTGNVDEAALFAAWLDAWIWIPVALAITVFMLVLFPDGRLHSSHWRYVLLGASAAGGLAAVAIAFHPEFAGQYGTAYHNMFALPPLAEQLELLFYASSLLMVGAMVAGVAALLLRHRASFGVERRQVEWLLAGGVVGIAGFVLVLAFPSKLTEFIVVVGFMAIPAAATIAILRYRLWDIDLIINRALVYVPLSGILFGLYSVTVTVLQRLFMAITGERSDAAIVLSALALAAIFQPVRQRLQSAVDAHFKGDPDPVRRLESFARQVEASYHLSDPRRLARRFARETMQSTGASGVTAILAAAPAPVSISAGAPVADVALRVPLVGAGRQLGELLVAERRGGRPYTDRERDALHAAAGCVGRAIADAEAAMTRADTAPEPQASTTRARRRPHRDQRRE